MISIGEVHAEKIAEAVLLYVFKIAFPAPLILLLLHWACFSLLKAVVANMFTGIFKNDNTKVSWDQELRASLPK